MKRLLIFLALLSLSFVMVLPAVSQIRDGRTRQEVFDQISYIVTNEPGELTLPDSGLDILLDEFAFNSEGEVTESMRILIEEIADDPSVHLTTRKVAVSALRLFSPELEVDRIRNLIDQKGLKIESAALLAEWGFWDEAKPVLIEHGAWRSLAALGEQSEVEPIIRSAIEDRSLPIMSRLYASSALEAYGDTLTQQETARSVLRDYLLDNQPVDDMKDLTRAISTSCNILIRGNQASDLYLMEAGLTYPNSNIRYFTASAIGKKAREDSDPIAIEILEYAKENSEFSEVRKIARKATKRIANKQGD